MDNHLTNEKIRSKFDNQFDLVNYAIKLAVNMIKCHRESRVKIDSQNRAMIILAEIEEGKDSLDNVSSVESTESGKYSTKKEADSQTPEIEAIES